MTLAPEEAYHTNHAYELHIFDLRDQAAVENLYHARAIWQTDSDIEALDEDRFVLVVRLGAAKRLPS
jgi:hypothetical protein